MTTAKKTPQDRKPKAEKIVRPQDVAGFDLLLSIDDVPVWDQAPLLALVQKLSSSADEESGTIDMDESDAIIIIGQVGKAMLPFAIDQKKFTKFCTGRDALQRIMDLAMAWTSVLGEDKSSGDS